MPPTPAPPAPAAAGQGAAAGRIGKKRQRSGDTNKHKAKASSKAKADTAQQQQQQQQQQRIDGVPPSLTPVLLHAIKSRRKYLVSQQRLAATATATATAPTDTAAATAAASDPADVLARVAARSDQEHRRRRAAEAADSPLERLRWASEDATAAFLNGVRREANGGGGGGRNENGWSIDPVGRQQGRAGARGHGGGGGGAGAAASVPVASLAFLLGLFFANDGSVKLPTRRAALALASDLLQRSAECREGFASPERLRQFIEVVSSVGSSPGRDTNRSSAGAGSDEEGDAALRMLVQQEAVQLLASLSDRFGSYYPRLTVAARYLEEREGIALWQSFSSSSSSSSANSGGSGLGDLVSNNAMVDLRRGRDMAMAKVDKAYGRIRKILDRADECFEILVPRIGGRGGAPVREAMQDAITLASKWRGDDGDESDEEDDDEDGIDWEEGDDDDDDDDDDGIYKAPKDHEKAVERTLAQMERSRGIEDGAIEIRLGNNGDVDAESSGGGVDGASSVTTAATRKMLGRCVQLLDEKHMPRLAFWLDCLHKADNMVIQQAVQHAENTLATVHASLVAMPPLLRKKRSETLKVVSALKSDCVNAMTSACQLGIGSSSTLNVVELISQSAGERNGKTDAGTNAKKEANPTGVGVVTASISANASWKRALGIKATKPKKKKMIRIKIVSASSRKSAVQIKARKGL